MVLRARRPDRATAKDVRTCGLGKHGGRTGEPLNTDLHSNPKARSRLSYRTILQT